MMVPGGVRGSVTSMIDSDLGRAISGICVHVETSLLNGAYNRIWMLRLTSVGVIGIGCSGSCD